MIISNLYQSITLQDSIIQKPDTADRQIISIPDSISHSDTLENISVTRQRPGNTDRRIDTTADGSKPVLTFQDSLKYLQSSQQEGSKSFPFTFVETNTRKRTYETESLIKALREGEKPVLQPLKGDWMVFIILIVSVIYIFISSVFSRLFSDMKRFFLFRGVGDPASYDIQLLFNWKSTIINLVSFLNLGLLLYCAADYYEFIPEIIPSFIFWIICVTGIIVSISIRHIICHITGNISGETDLFNEYIITIYQSYRYLAIIFFFIAVLILYTKVFTVNSLFFIGLSALLITYFIRIIRLFLIFLKKNISIFYFILYLCALEFLPVLVIIKYITGLF